MNHTFIIDASLAAAWVFNEENSKAALDWRRQAQEQQCWFCAPSFLQIELQSVAWKKVRRGLLKPNDPILSSAPTFGLDLNWFDTAALATHSLSIALRFDITVYDALYVVLAQRLQASLATCDSRLLRSIQNRADIPIVVL